MKSGQNTTSTKHHRPQRRRRRRRMSAAPSIKKSGETFVRVFEGTPIGLVIQSDHSVEEVIKSYQGDLAGVLAGDTIVEINHKCVNPMLSSIDVSMFVVKSQKERGRVRCVQFIFFFLVFFFFECVLLSFTSLSSLSFSDISF